MIRIEQEFHIGVNTIKSIVESGTAALTLEEAAKVEAWVWSQPERLALVQQQIQTRSA